MFTVFTVSITALGSTSPVDATYHKVIGPTLLLHPLGYLQLLS